MATLYTNFTWGFNGERQSMLVDGGKVVERGSEVGGEADQVVDLSGKWLMPSFIDSHCHVLPTGLDLQKLHLGPHDSHESVLQALAERLPEVEPGRWLSAVHYDQTRYEDGRHLTRDDLDKVSEHVPIILRHVNGHASIANSAALSAAQIADDEPDFPGGTFRRDETGRIDGVLLEHAHEKVSAAAPYPTFEDMVQAILKAGERMSELGIACASDMMTGRFDLRQELAAYTEAARRGCKVRTRLYLQWGAVFGGRGISREELAELTSGMNAESCRIAGIKIFADGAIGSATAAIYGRYTGESAAGPIISPNMRPLSGEASGSLMYSPEKLTQMTKTAHDAGYQVAVHSIGDYATDLVMNAFEATDEPSRHRIEHAMILSDGQIERMAKLGCYCTMQPEFLMRFGHSYKRQLGPERAAHLNRTRSVWDAGIRLSFSSDRPIVAGDPRDGIRTASHRPEGYDAREAVTPREAWLAYTANGADVNGDRGSMGSLSAGQFADFQVLDSDPFGSG